MSNEQPKWVTVGTFPHGMDMIHIEHELTARGIAFNKLDETTVQVLPHLSQALGGVRLQVAPGDAEVALKVLSTAGVEIEAEQEGSPLLHSFDRITQGLPVINAVPLGWRFVLVFGVIAVLLGGAIYWLLVPTLSEQLAARKWCVQRLNVNGSELQANTVSGGMLVIVMMNCPESVEFSLGGTVKFPGIETPEVNASWELVNDKISVFDADTLNEIYDGEYTVQVDDFRMIMRSATTLITTERDRTLENMFRGL